MPANYNGSSIGRTAREAVTLSLPVDGDARNAESVNAALRVLADKLKYVEDQGVFQDVVNTVAQLLTLNGPGTDTGGVIKTTSAPAAGGRKLLWETLIGSGMYARLYASSANNGFELTFNAKWRTGTNDWVPDAASGAGGTPMTRFGLLSSIGTSGVDRDTSFFFDYYDNGASGAAISEATFALKRISWGNADGKRAWTNVGAFSGTWVNFGAGKYSAAYRLVSNGVSATVELSGSIKSGVVGTTAFVLPAAYRPANEVQLACAANGALGIITIDTAGNVTVTAGSATRTDLNGLSFRLN